MPIFSALFLNIKQVQTKQAEAELWEMFGELEERIFFTEGTLYLHKLLDTQFSFYFSLLNLSLLCLDIEYPTTSD